MKILLENETNNPNALLRKLTRLVAKEKGITDNIFIRFYKSRSSWSKRCNVHGRAFVGLVSYGFFNPNTKKMKLGQHRSLRIGLPDDWKTRLITVCQVMEHEFDHTLGLQHKDMINYSHIEIGYLDQVETLVNG